MRYTVPNILACQCQPVVSGGHTHKAVNKATLTDRLFTSVHTAAVCLTHLTETAFLKS